MPNTPEAAATRLLVFIQAVQRRAGGKTSHGSVSSEIRASPRKDQLTATYEECLSELSEIERDQLNQMIEKMSRILGSPPQAVIPS